MVGINPLTLFPYVLATHAALLHCYWARCFHCADTGASCTFYCKLRLQASFFPTTTLPNATTASPINPLTLRCLAASQPCLSDRHVNDRKRSHLLPYLQHNQLAEISHCNNERGHPHQQRMDPPLLELVPASRFEALHHQQRAKACDEEDGSCYACHQHQDPKDVSLLLDAGAAGASHHWLGHNIICSSSETIAMGESFKQHFNTNGQGFPSFELSTRCQRLQPKLQQVQATTGHISGRKWQWQQKSRRCCVHDNASLVATKSAVGET